LECLFHLNQNSVSVKEAIAINDENICMDLRGLIKNTKTVNMDPNRFTCILN